MKHSVRPILPALAAIAALSSAPLFAQDTPAAVEQAVADTADSSVAPAAPAAPAVVEQAVADAADSSAAPETDAAIRWFEENGFEFAGSAESLKAAAAELKALARREGSLSLATLAKGTQALARRAEEAALKSEEKTPEEKRAEADEFASGINDTWADLDKAATEAAEAAKAPAEAAKTADAAREESLARLGEQAKGDALSLTDAYHAYLAAYLRSVEAKAAADEAAAAADEAAAAASTARKDYIGEYADNVQNDAAFDTHIKAALDSARTDIPAYGTFWSVFPALLAILLALLTKEVYSSLFLGILAGGIIYARGSFEGTIVHVFSDGYIASIADAYNVGILVFLVLLGALVAMMNKTGASAAFGKWADSHIKSRVGAQIATIVLGMLIFVDDYFNCLTVGSVMRPVTDTKKVSRAKLAYLIDATAAPICIIAPISSWAAAVAGFAKGAGAESGFSLFVNAIPWNFYAILTIVAMFFFALTGFDFGSMRKHEENAIEGDLFTSGGPVGSDEFKNANPKGRVYDLIIPVVVLVAACIVGMIYSGGFFGADKPGFIKAFSDSDASVGLVYGSAFAIVFAIVYFLCRRVISFKDCMDSLPEGFKAMVPAILILCFAWTLKAMTDSLGAKVFISQIINGPAAGLQDFLPAIIFLIAIVLAFSTGTSWGTFGILIPIVLAAAPSPESTIISVSACMAGAVCGDHCSPISDTTIMASAGAGCNHVNHVNTQLPYALLVAAVSFVAYIVAPFLKTWYAALPVAIVLMLAVLFGMRAIIGKRKAA